MAFTGDVIDEWDNCTPSEATFEDSVDSTNLCAIIIRRIWSLADSCGNSAIDQVQIITVMDSISPTFNVPSDITIYKDTVCNYDAGIEITGIVTNETDNCDISKEASYSDVTDFTNPCAVLITRAWSLIDDCGNITILNQIIKVVDTISPTASNPEPIYVECIEDVPQPDINIVNDATDNCSDIITIDFEGEEQFSFGTGLIRTLERQYSVTDICGNQTMLTHYIYINGLPHAEDDYYTIDENSKNNIFQVLINDDFGCDGYGEVGIQIANLPMYGEVSPNNNNSPFDPTDDFVVYTPIRNNYFSDSFDYVIWDKSGDFSIATVFIDFIPNLLHIPEAFSPDGDGINDLFHIRGLFYYPNNSIVIFDQKGNTIFEANPYVNDWGGRNMFTGELLSQDTYFYLFDKGDGSHKMKGFVYLIPR